jgi:hypothetical protein
MLLRRGQSKIKIVVRYIHNTLLLALKSHSIPAGNAYAACLRANSRNRALAIR